MNPIQRKKLVEALVGAYSRQEDLEVMLALELGASIDVISAPGAKLKKRVLDVVRYYEARGTLDALLVGAASHLDGGNPGLEAIATELQLGRAERSPGAVRAYSKLVRGIASQQDRQGYLQRVLSGAPEQVDPKVFTAWLERACATVARVEHKDKQIGSACLVGTNVALTNQHVAAEIVDAKKVVLRFDYQSGASGLTVAPGVEHRLASNASWLMAARPPSPNDPNGPVQANELDYALLRLSTPAGDDLLDSGAKRGFIDIAGRVTDVNQSELLTIVQYPEKLPLQFAPGNALQYANQQRRLRYAISTEHGSSGSPVFDMAFDIVALHHSGDGGSTGGGWNQGIPIQQILQDLVSNGKANLVGADTVI